MENSYLKTLTLSMFVACCVHGATPNVNPRNDNTGAVGTTNKAWATANFHQMALSNDWYVNQISTNYAPVSPSHTKLMTEQAILDAITTVTGSVSASDQARWDLAHTWVTNNSNGVAYIFSRSNAWDTTWNIVNANQTNWTLAYNWYSIVRGTVADYDYGTSASNQIPNWGDVTNLFAGYVASTGQLTEAERDNWNTAYGWGDHGTNGYRLEADWVAFSNSLGTIIYKDYGTNTYSEIGSWGDVTNFVLTRITANEIPLATQALWNTAYTWVNTESNNVTVLKTQSVNWNKAYDWLKDTGDAKVGDMLIWQSGVGWVNVPVGDTNTVLRSTGSNSVPTWQSASGIGDMLKTDYDTNDNSIVDTSDAFIASVAFNITSANTSNWTTAYGWGDHSTNGYLVATTNDKANWNTAYGWGDHSTNNYLDTESDPIFTNWLASANTSNWDEAYSWGDHSLVGYLLASTFNSWTGTLGSVIFKDYGTNLSTDIPDLGWITNYVAGQTGTNIVSDTDRANWNTAYTAVTNGTSNWDQAYTWVNAGRANWDNAYTWVNAGRANWDTAYGWGDHGAEGYRLEADWVTYSNTLGTIVTYDQGTADSEIPTYSEVVDYVNSVTLPEYDVVTVNLLQGTIDYVVTNVTEEYDPTSVALGITDTFYDQRPEYSHIIYRMSGSSTIVYDASDPTTPTAIATNTHSTWDQFTHALYVSGGTTSAYNIGTTYYAPGSNPEMGIINIGNPTNYASATETTYQRNTYGDLDVGLNAVFGTYHVGNYHTKYAFVAQNPSDGTIYDNISLNTDDTDYYDHVDIDAEDQVAYVWSYRPTDATYSTNIFVSVVDISDLSNMVQVAYFTITNAVPSTFSTRVKECSAYNGKLYFPTESGVRYYDTTDTSNILDKGVVLESTTYPHMAIWEQKMLFTAQDTDDAGFYDARQPNRPEQIQSYDMTVGNVVVAMDVNINKNEVLYGFNNGFAIYSLNTVTERSPVFIEKLKPYKIYATNTLFYNVPTATNGLDSGQLWSSNGVLRIYP